MEHSEMLYNYELVHVIVSFGQGSKILKFIKKHGVSNATVALAHGTINNKLLDFIGLADIRKEVVCFVTNKCRAYEISDEMNQLFHFNKPNHGILFTTSVCNVVGSKCSNDNSNRIEEEVKSMYHLITTIVDRGMGEEVVSAATAVGSKGGTILNGRGCGIDCTDKLFAMDIEPEKEIVIILSEVHQTDTIVNSIKQSLNIGEAGNGVIYVQDTIQTYGIYK